MQDILLEYLRNQSEVIIFGAGTNGKFLKWFFDKNQVNIQYFCDSNKNLWGKKIDNIDCISPEDLLRHNNAVILVSPVKYDDIKKRLEKWQFKKKLYWDDIKFLKEKYQDSKEQILMDALLEDTNLRNILRRNKRFKDIHKGKRCFIIGNGPSVLGEDLSVLANEITFTVNQIARNPQFKDIHTNYHLWADSLFFKTELKSEGDFALLELVKDLPNDTESFFRYDCMREYIEKFDIDKFINVNYYAAHALVDEQAEIDFSGYIKGAWTVVQYAIRLAIYMGFKDIYLLGCDCTAIMSTINARLSSYSFQSHCYDIDDYEREREREMYMELPLQVYYQAEINLLNGYESLKKYCSGRSINIYNCTQGGLLDYFPRKKLSDVLNNN